MHKSCSSLSLTDVWSEVIYRFNTKTDSGASTEELINGD